MINDNDNMEPVKGTEEEYKFQNPNNQNWNSSPEEGPFDAEAYTQDSIGSSIDGLIAQGRIADQKSEYAQSTSGREGLALFNERLDLFSNADWSASASRWDQVSLDIQETAAHHATNDKFFVNTIHEGAWNNAKSMTSDEPWSIIGTNMRARNQWIFDSSENTTVARIVGLKNTDRMHAAVAERGVDPTRRGSFEDTITDFTSAIFQYDDIATDFATFRDPNWDKESQANAWEGMNATPQGRYLVKATGMTQERLAELPNQDMVIYSMNRMYSEARFAQHAAQDNWGGMGAIMGQMGAEIVSDIDTVGELGLALAAGTVSGGAGTLAYGSYKAGKLTATTRRLAKVAEFANNAARFLPTRVIGDALIPMTKAMRASKGMGSTAERLNTAFRTMDKYDNYATFLAGASADGFVGGAGAFMMNTATMDRLNEVVYGKGVMPSVDTWGARLERGVMGVGGAIVLGSGMRVTFQQLGKLPSAIANGDAWKIDRAKVAGMDKPKAQATVTEGRVRKSLKAAGVTDEGIISQISMVIDNTTAEVGGDVRIVVEAVARTETSSPEAAPAELRAAARTAVAKEASTVEAQMNRVERQELLNEAAAKAEGDANRMIAETNARNNELQTEAIVRAAEAGADTPDKLADESVPKMEEADQAKIEELIDARADAETKGVESRDAARNRKDVKAEGKKSDNTKAKELEAQQVAADEAKARLEAEAAEAAKAAEKAATEAADQRARLEAAEAKKAKAEATVAAEKKIQADAKGAAPSEARTKKLAASKTKEENAAVEAKKLAKENARIEEAAKAAEKAAENTSKVVEAKTKKAAEVERPTEYTPKGEGDNKTAKAKDIETSMTKAAADERVKELTAELAKAWGVDEAQVELLLSEAIHWNAVRADKARAEAVVKGFENEEMDELPVEIVRHALASVNPAFAEKWDAGDVDGISIKDARGLIKDAARNKQGLYAQSLLDNPNAVFTAGRLTRTAYGEMKERLESIKAETIPEALRVASHLKLLTNGGNLRDYDFKGDGIYLKGQAYYDQAMENLKDLVDTVDALDVALPKTLDEITAELQAEKLVRKSMKAELSSKYGYSPSQEFTRVPNLEPLLAHHRYVAQIDDAAAAGTIDKDVLAMLGLDPQSTAAYFQQLVTNINNKIDLLMENGELTNLSEVDMLSLFPQWSSAGESKMGQNFRDSIFNAARRVEDTGTFDLGLVRAIAEERLARVDADFNRARVAAANGKIAVLNGKVADGTADVNDRIELSAYNNRSKVVNEADFLEDHIIPAYEAVSQAQAKKAHDILVRTLGQEEAAKMRDFLLEEENYSIDEGISAALFSAKGFGAGARNAFFHKYGINPKDFSSQETMDKVAATKAFRRVVEKELGVDLISFVDGSKGYSRGLEVGHAAIAALRDGRTLTGAAPSTIKADFKNRGVGSGTANVDFSGAKETNPIGNLSVRKQVQFLEKYLVAEGQRQIMYNADGTPRQLTTDQSKAIIDWYENMKERSAEEIKENTPNHPYEQSARQDTLVPRENIESPLRDWVSPSERVHNSINRMLREPVGVHQGVHDDLTIAIERGTTLSIMGAIGPEIARNAQWAGDGHGAGGGWQSAAVTPGSVMDFLNMRSEAVFKQFEGMAEMARVFGMRGLMDIQEAVVADLLVKAESELKEGEKLSTEELYDIDAVAEAMSLAELEDAIRFVDEGILTGAFTGNKFEERLNSWDASSQAVALAKGLWGNVEFNKGNRGLFIDQVKSALGWSTESGGLISPAFRGLMLSKGGEGLQSGSISNALLEGDLIEEAADFYSKVWDFLVDNPVRVGGEPMLKGELTADNDGDESSFVSSRNFNDNRTNEDDIETSRLVWEELLTRVGRFGSKSDIKAGLKQGGEVAALASMKQFMRNNLMKRPVMTRAYGAGGGALTNAIAEFLEEAFTVNTEEAKMFRSLMGQVNPEYAARIEAEATAGDRTAGSALYAMASNLGWSFADRANAKRGKSEGQVMGQALDLPDAKTFRDGMRSVATLAKDALDPAATDLRVHGYTKNAGSDKAEGGWSERDITLDDLYTMRTDEDSKLPKPKKGEAPKEPAENENQDSLAEAITAKAIAVAERRGWSGGDSLMESLGKWHMRNLLLVKSGGATLAQIKSAEKSVQVEMAKIIESAKSEDQAELRIQEYLENWLTRADSLTLRAMNSAGFAARPEVWNSTLESAGLETGDLLPLRRMQVENGTVLHSAVSTAAGRGFTSSGQGGKGNESAGVTGVHRAVTEEHPNAAMELTRKHSRDWQSVSAEERERIAYQLAVQDMMIDFLGTQNPPLHLLGDTFTEGDMRSYYEAWAAVDHRTDGIAEAKAEARQKHAEVVGVKAGTPVSEKTDILQEDVRGQTMPYMDQSLFGRAHSWKGGEPGTSAGIPQFQLHKLKQTEEHNVRTRMDAASKNKVSGIGVSLNEMAVPAALTIAGKLGGMPNANLRPVSPSSDFGSIRLEENPGLFAKYMARQALTFAASAGLPVPRTRAGLAEVWKLMHVERAFQAAMGPQSSATRFAAKDGDSKSAEEVDMTVASDQKLYMDMLQRDINGYLTELFGEVEVPADKTAGSRNVQRLDNDKVVYSSTGLMDGLSKSFTEGGNRNNMDALLGPAHRAGMILEGDNMVNGALLTGLMAKSVFHNDFGIGMGAAEESIRFNWWLARRDNPGMSDEDLALNFSDIMDARIERSEEGLVQYEKDIKEWKSGKVDQKFINNDTMDLMSLGAVRARIANNPEAKALTQQIFGDTELTDEFLRGLKTQQPGADNRTPDAFMDSLGRVLSMQHVPTGTVLWRTMAQFKAASVDPQSQPVVRRLWMASVMEMELGRLGLAENMGATNRKSRAWDHINGKADTDRLDASAKVAKEELGVDPWRGDDVTAGGGEEERVITAAASMDRLAKLRGRQFMEILGLMSQKELDVINNKRSANKLGPIKQKTVSPQLTYLYFAADGDFNKFMALTKHMNRQAGANRSGSMTNVDTYAEVGDEAAVDTFNLVKGVVSSLDEELKSDLTAQIETTLAGENYARDADFTSERVAAILSATPGVRLITDSAAEAVVDGVMDRATGKLLTDGDPTAADTDPVFGGGRTLSNDLDDVVMRKRYPSVYAVVKELEDHGVFKDATEAKRFATLLVMNQDVLSNILPGIKFNYVGETGTARMQTTLNNAQEMKHRIDVLNDVRDLDAIEAFDIIVHEVGHAIIHRAMAVQGGARGTSPANKALGSIKSDFRNRLLKGGAESKQAFLSSFIAIYGEKKGTENFSVFYKEVMGSTGRSEYDVATQEFMATMMSWHILSRNDSIATVSPYMKQLGAVYNAGYGERIRQIGSLVDGGDKHKGLVLADGGKVRGSLEKLAQIGNTADPVIWKGRRQWEATVLNHPGMHSVEALAKQQDEVRAHLAENPDDMVAQQKLISISRRLGESGMATTSREAILRGVQSNIASRGPKDEDFLGALVDAGLTKAEIEGINARVEAGETVPVDEYGTVNTRNMTSDQRAAWVDAALDRVMHGRHDGFRDGIGGKVRSAVSFVGEGIVMQGMSAARRAGYDELDFASNMLNSNFSSETRTSDEGATDMVSGISVQQIDLMQRAKYGKPISAGIELMKITTKQANKGNGQFVKDVDDSFNVIFIDPAHAKSSPAFRRLQMEDPQAAALVLEAATEFAKRYDDAYAKAESVGDMTKSVVKSLTGDGNRQLPLQLSEAFKQDNALGLASRDLGDEINRVQNERSATVDPLDGSTPVDRAGYLSADLLHDYGVLAPFKADAGNDVIKFRQNHTENMDENYPGLVDAIIRQAKEAKPEESEFTVTGSRHDQYFAASEILEGEIRHGKLFTESMDPVIVKSYQAILERSKDGIFPRDAATNKPFFDHQLARDFPDPKERAKVRALMNSGAATMSPSTYRGLVMLWRARHGGYAFGDSQFITPEATRRIVSTYTNPEGAVTEGAPNSGINTTPLALMKSFMAQDFDWTERSLNQVFFGIRGYGFRQLLSDIEARIHRGTLTADGVHSTLSGPEAQKLIAAVEQLRIQANLAAGRKPGSDQDAGQSFLDAAGPHIQTAVALMTTPNWTSASLVVEGTAGIVKGIVGTLTSGKWMMPSVGKYGTGMDKLRDEMHAIGVTMPYHMTSLGFGHIWSMGEEAHAVAEMDPTLNPGLAEKISGNARKLGSFGFQRIQLSQRAAQMQPAMKKIRSMFMQRPDKESRMHELARALQGVTEVTPAIVRKAARKAGVERRMAAQMFQMGLLTPENVRAMQSDVVEFMQAGKNFDYQGLFDKVDFLSPRRRPDSRGLAARENETTMQTQRATGLQQLLATEVAKTNLEPQVGSNNAATNPLIRMWQSLSQYAIILMHEAAAHMAATGVIGGVAMLAPLYIGETVWYALNRMKNGESPEKIMADLSSDPIGQMTLAAARMPVFGPGSMVVEAGVKGGLGLVGRAFGGVGSSVANERSYGITTPGMPGPNMLFQGVGILSDTATALTDAAVTGEWENAGEQAKEAVRKLAPLDYRPFWVTASRMLMDDWKESAQKPATSRNRIETMLTADGFLPQSNKGPRKTTAQQDMAADYAKRKADLLVGSKPPSAPEAPASGGQGVSTPPPTIDTSASPQTGSSGSSGSMGPGTAELNL